MQGVQNNQESDLLRRLEILLQVNPKFEQELKTFLCSNADRISPDDFIQHLYSKDVISDTLIVIREKHPVTPDRARFAMQKVCDNLPYTLGPLVYALEETNKFFIPRIVEWLNKRNTETMTTNDGRLGVQSAGPSVVTTQSAFPTNTAASGIQARDVIRIFNDLYTTPNFTEELAIFLNSNASKLTNEDFIAKLYEKKVIPKSPFELKEDMPKIKDRVGYAIAIVCKYLPDTFEPLVYSLQQSYEHFFLKDMLKWLEGIKSSY